MHTLTRFWPPSLIRRYRNRHRAVVLTREALEAACDASYEQGWKACERQHQRELAGAAQ